MNPEHLRSFFDACPPFTKLSDEERHSLFQTASALHAPAGTVIFKQGEPPTDLFYIVVSGTIQLSESEGGREEIREENKKETKEEIVDLCETGAIFGIKARLGDRNYIYTASAREESDLLSLSYSRFLPFLETHAEVALFFAAGFASGRYQKLSIDRVEEARRIYRPGRPSGFFLEGETIPLSAIRSPLECDPDLSIRDAADLMTGAQMGSILVVDAMHRPIGIVTDTDFRVKVGGGRYRSDDPIRSIMSSPVYTIPRATTVSSLTLLMMREGFHHVCITRDGTDRSPAIGILSEHDVLLINDHNPAVIVKEILNNDRIEILRSLMDRTESLIHMYLQQEVSPAFICEVVSEINDVLIRRATELTIQKLLTTGWSLPPYPYSFLSLGSEGRKEQLLRTDQDNALVFSDPPADELEDVQAAFLRLGKGIVGILAECGFQLCPGNVMASNPELCQPLSSWKRRFAGWIEEPKAEAILSAAIYFDLRCTAGSEALTDELIGFVRQRTKDSRLFLRFLAKDAVRSQPPLGFFRTFLVEKSGEHKDRLDLKLRGLMPLSCAGRLLAFETGYEGDGTTHLRLRYAAERLPAMRDAVHEASIVYPFLLRLRTMNALNHPERKNFLNPDELNRLDRQTLKNAFQIIDSLQRDLKGTYQLDELP